jgi:hypothetical protein
LVLSVAFAAIRLSAGEIPIRNADLEALWISAPSGSTRVFDSALAANFPEPARRYIEHVIAPGTRLASSAKLVMQGEIKLGSAWHPFQAEQVLSSNGEFIWAASTSMYGLPIIGSDRLVQGKGSMRWELLDFFPVVSDAGSDITRSAIGRLQGEFAAWLPSVLFDEVVGRSTVESGKLRVLVKVLGEAADVDLEIDGQGRLRTIKLMRWGNPDGLGNRYADFGVVVEGERSFNGYTVPSRIRAGWFFGTERFESEGQFFRATISNVVYK